MDERIPSRQSKEFRATRIVRTDSAGSHRSEAFTALTVVRAIQSTPAHSNGHPPAEVAHGNYWMKRSGEPGALTERHSTAPTARHLLRTAFARKTDSEADLNSCVRDNPSSEAGSSLVSPVASVDSNTEPAPLSGSSSLPAPCDSFQYRITVVDGIEAAEQWLNRNCRNGYRLARISSSFPPGRGTDQPCITLVVERPASDAACSEKATPADHELHVHTHP
ncbi:MAG TPA: hypothetical protein VGS41_10465 [Chthonomonadales bacterium]|nr:hypothetical protein [Chthonomonadales bacterium]